MASIKLHLIELEQPQSVWFRRPGGAVDSIPLLRLVAYTNFMRALVPARDAGKYAITECLVDTGAFFSVIAEDLWRRFRPGFVTPLPFDARTPPGLRTLTIAGGTYPYALGELTLTLQDRDLNTLAVTVVAKLAEDGGRFNTPLTLGLRGGFLDGRKLRAEPDPAAPFGQLWAVADA